MSQLGLILQESLRPQREARTILGLLTQHMDGTDREETRTRRTLKERFRFAGMGCCGATWVFRPIFRHEQQQQHQEGETTEEQQQRQVQDPAPSDSGMNLATALAAERQMRGSEEISGGGGGEGGTPWRVSLMRLLEETEKETEKTTVTEGNDSACCVCMGRKKGAAFIPCGHTFCRVCSRELWLNRGSCPLCNRSILEILDIF